MRAHIHDGREPISSNLKAGYIGARPECFTLTDFLLQRTAGPYIGSNGSRPVARIRSTRCPAFSRPVRYEEKQRRKVLIFSFTSKAKMTPKRSLRNSHAPITA